MYLPMIIYPFMNQRKRLFLALLMFFIARVATSTGQIIRNKGTGFLQKIEKLIELHNESGHGTNLQDCTVFHVAEKEYGIVEFSKICESFFSKSEQDKMVTIITLRNFYTNEPYNADDTIAKFIKAMHECINGEKTHTLLDNLGLTIDYIKQEYLDNFDALRVRTENITKIYKEFHMLVVDFFPSICCDAIVKITHNFVYAKLKCCNLLTVPLDDANQAILEGQNENLLTKFSDCLFNYVLCDNLNEFCYYNVSRDSAIFKAIYNKICMLEKKIKISHFTNNEGNLHELYLYVINIWFNEPYRRCLSILIPKYREFYEKEENQKSLAKIYAKIYTDTVKQRIIRELNTKLEFNRFFATFYNSDEVLQLFRNFYKDMDCDELKETLEKVFKAFAVDCKKVILSERYTQIIYNGKVETESTYQLSVILKNAKLLEIPYKCQSIYIDKGRVMSNGEALAFSDVCDKLCIDSVSDGKIELFSVIKSNLKDEKCQRLENFTYKRLVSEQNSEGIVSYQEAFEKTNLTTIALKKWDKPEWKTIDRIIKCLKEICLSVNKSEIEGTHEISVVNEFGSSSIIIILQNSDLKDDIVSLIYNMPVADKTANGGYLINSARCIKCVDNVPESSLDDLYGCLLVQLTLDTAFKCPHLFSMDDLDLKHSEQTYKIDSVELLIDLISYYLCKNYKHEDLYQSNGPTSVKHILESNIETFFSDDAITRCIKNLETKEGQLTDTIRSFLLRKGVINAADLESNPSYYWSSREIILFAAPFGSGSIMMHFCEIRKNNHIHNITVNLAKNFMLSLKLKDSFRTFTILEDLSKHRYCKASFIATMINDISKAAEWTLINREYDQQRAKIICIRLIYKHIEGLFAELRDMAASTDSQAVAQIFSKLPDYQKLLNPNEIEEMAETIAARISCETNSINLKVISVKIKRSNDACKHDLEDFEFNEHFEQYEDASFLNWR